MGAGTLPATSLIFRLLPPLVIQPEEIDRIVAALDETLGAITG